MPEVDRDFTRPAPGRVLTDKTWGDVEFGTYVIDKNDRMHLVTREGSGWVQLQAVRDGVVVSLRKPEASVPVRIYEPSEDECRNLLESTVGAHILRDIERREHTIARRLLWRIDPIARNAKALRDHLDMIHGVNVNDVLRVHAGTAVNPSTRTTKRAKLDELADLHDEVHADPHLWPQDFPHHHQRIQEDS